MSTFDGVVIEFPDIRIDFFRRDPASRPALAFFHSHVHSDHLAGVESCRAPFIYCSSATREILLRLEKYPHRLNFAAGILEARKQTYRGLRNLLKPIPLETPTTVELSPGSFIRVTLFDANHCVGAVMFLIEGDGKAILYTGDVRSEPWWVNSISRHPVLIPYLSSAGKHALKCLDNIYLDTTFATKEHLYWQFPSKAQGVSELLEKVAKYPKDTVFYFDAWTFGYEDVWQALSTFLDSQIHVDDYRYGIYAALLTNTGARAPEASRLIGAQVGNFFQEGCLTKEQTRIHSCERGTGCSILDQRFVRITPIISRHNGVEVAELGAGGGKGDLNQQHELEIDSDYVAQELMRYCVSKFSGQPQLLASLLQILVPIMDDPRKRISLDGLEIAEQLTSQLEGVAGDVSIETVVMGLAKRVVQATQKAKLDPVVDSGARSALPKQITFAYSRHSDTASCASWWRSFCRATSIPVRWTIATGIRSIRCPSYSDTFTRTLSLSPSATTR